MAIGTVIHLFSVCSSTNDMAKELTRRGASDGTVVIADEQREGRGTKSRSWYSPAGLGLYMSVILRPPESDVSLLPMVAGIAVVEAILSTTGLEVRLKWPNDIIWSGKKLGGILCESEFIGPEISCAILGIGLNIGQRKKDFPPCLQPTAVSLRMVLKRPVDRERLAERLFQALDAWYGRFLSGKKMDVLRAFEAKLIFPIGKVVNIKAEKRSHTGLFLGFDLGGRLMLEENGGKVFFSPAEILEIGYNT